MAKAIYRRKLLIGDLLTVSGLDHDHHGPEGRGREAADRQASSGKPGGHYNSN